MCYNFATFVLYLDVITLIYRENRLTSSEPSLSAESSKSCFLRFMEAGCFLIYIINRKGEMLEWLKRHAWKACKPLKGFAGSNPAFSAKS